jgi:hypothetical protein
MTRASAGLIVAFACLAIASPAASFQLPFTATLKIQFRTIPPLVIPGTGSAELSVAPGGAIQKVQLATSITATGVDAGPIPSSWAPIDGLQGTFGLWPTSSPLPLRTFERGTSGNLAGVVRVLGVVRVCLFSPGGCPGANDVFIRLDHATPGTGSSFYDAAVGWQGTWAGPAGGGVNVTVRGAPWTTGTVDAGGGLTAMGFAHGPLGFEGTTARNGGQLNLVTPIFISTSLPTVPLFPAIATLAAEFTADPTTCANGIDDDGDGLTDFPDDPACQTQTFARENAQCQDGQSNDGDGLIDFDGGAWANGGVPVTAPDPQCVARPWRNKETPDSSCGLGAELVLVFGALGWARVRQRRLGTAARSETAGRNEIELR